MNRMPARVLLYAVLLAFTGIWPVSAQFEPPPPIGALTALPGEEIRENIWTKTVESVEVTVRHSGSDGETISHFISSPCQCKNPTRHDVRLKPLPTGLYEVHLHARDADVIQVLSVSTFGLIVLLTEREGVVMPIDLRTRRVRHDVTLSLSDTTGQSAIPIVANGLGHTGALAAGTRTLVGRASDGSVVSQIVRVQAYSAARTYGYLDRATYRPGDAVYYTAISRFRTPSENTPFFVAASNVVVPSATEVYRSSCCVTYAFRIPPNTKPGYYWVPPSGDFYVEPRADSTDGVEVAPLRLRYDIGETAEFAVSSRAKTSLRYEIWLQNNVAGRATDDRRNTLLKSGNTVAASNEIVKISAVVKQQASKVEARVYDSTSTVPAYVASADITPRIVQCSLNIPERRIVGQPLPIIARAGPASVVNLRIYSAHGGKILMSDRKRTDADGYALFTWYPAADGEYEAEESDESSPYPVRQSFGVGRQYAPPWPPSILGATAMPQKYHVAPGERNSYLVFVPDESDALVEWSNGSGFDQNVQRVGPVSRVMVPSDVTSDKVAVKIYGIANSQPWTIFRSFDTKPDMHRLHVRLLPFQNGVRIQVTDITGAPVVSGAIVTFKKASGAGLLAPFDDDAVYRQLYRDSADYLPYAQTSWGWLGAVEGSLATPTPDPRFGLPIPALPPTAASVIHTPPETLYFNPFIQTDASGTAKITFPWPRSARVSGVISALAITEDLRVGQAHAILRSTHPNPGTAN